MKKDSKSSMPNMDSGAMMKNAQIWQTICNAKL
jgi:hypothetical protein